MTGKTKKEKSQKEIASLEGEVSRIIYTSDETGYTVARLDVSLLDHPVTIVGYMSDIAIGVDLNVSGEWVTNKRFGRQFKVEKSSVIVPASEEGIRKYLGSGLIKGIGPAMAKKIVDKFGEDALGVIENNIDRLSEIEGIGKKKIQGIQRSWDGQREFKDLAVFLQKLDFGISYISKVHNIYGSDAIKIIESNPYKLAYDIPQVGFKRADHAASCLGIARDSAIRIEAGVIFILKELSSDGHVFCPYPRLLADVSATLEVDEELVRKAVAGLFLENRIVIEEVRALEGEESADGRKGVYLPNLHKVECDTAFMISQLVHNSGLAFTRLNQEEDVLVEKVERESFIQLSEKQKNAVKASINEKVNIITGGPGTGKTTIIKAVILCCNARGEKVLLAAPTGRAAKRLSETTGIEAKTIHRLLEFSVKDGGFKKNRENTLSADLVILDEVSMVDIQLFYYFLRAVSPSCRLVIVGDPNQLPSVGPGNVLLDIIKSGFVNVVELTEIFRQHRNSLIVKNAHRINNGEFPLIPKSSSDKLLDFYLIEKGEPEEALKLVKDLYKNRIVNRFKLSMLEDIQVLSPMNRGLLGTENLNSQIQELVNPCILKISKSDREFRMGDKVMQIKNNYDKEIFNGDIGFICELSASEKKLTVDYEGRLISYDYSELDELILSYAISVHKSQGSEYKAVIIPIMMSHYIMLQRNLIYTAVSRAKNLVVVVGSKKALHIAIQNNNIKTRYSNLSSRLAMLG